ncbi:MAG: ABC transporter permease [Dehalococcoidales bacterium]|nr:ABC transporter permease [Dehalococcoidales bacterium]
MILVLFIVTILVFVAMRLLPGDPILMFLTQENAESITQEEIAKIRHELGLDRSMLVQYFDWIGHVITGDLGKSIINHYDIADEVKYRMPISLHLGALAFMISIIIGIPLGVIAAIRRATWTDDVLTSLGNLGITIPTFWLGILFIYAFGLKLNLLPIFGYTSPFEDFWRNSQEIILPVFCLAVPAIASAVRLTRSSMLEVMRQDYVRTAWSKGLRERRVVMKHALKNGLIPVITLKGISLAHIVGGSVLIETVFSIPGMGRLAVDGLFAHDYSVVQATVLIVAVVVLASNMLIDLSYGWLDPRIRYH